MSKISKAASLGFSAATIAILSGASAQPASDFLYQLNYGVLPTAENAPEDGALSPAELMRQAKGYLIQMHQAAATVQDQAGGARNERDVVRVLCLNDKLTQITLAIHSAEERTTNLFTAATHNNRTQANHEFTIVRILKDRVSSLASDSNQCIGEKIGVVGETKVDTAVDPSVTDVDPLDPPVHTEPDNDTMLSMPPVISSPTR